MSRSCRVLEAKPSTMHIRREVLSMNLTRRDALKGIAAVSVVPLFPACAFAAPGDRGDVVTTNFDDGWLFLRGDAAGAHESGFDASAWRKVDLPHDWSIEDLPTQSASNGADAIWQDCNCPETAGPFSSLSRKFADKFDGITLRKPNASGAKSPLHFRKNVPQGLKAS